MSPSLPGQDTLDLPCDPSSTKVGAKVQPWAPLVTELGNAEGNSRSRASFWGEKSLPRAESPEQRGYPCSLPQRHIVPPATRGTQDRAVPRQLAPPDACEEQHRVRRTGTAMAKPWEWRCGNAVGDADDLALCPHCPVQGEQRALSLQDPFVGSSLEKIWDRDGDEVGKVQAMYQSTW